MMVPGIPPEMMEAYGIPNLTAVNDIRKKAVAKRKVLVPPKSALPARPRWVYAVQYQDGRTKVWFERGPWQKLRDRVHQHSWPAPIVAKNDDRPRFYVGEVDWAAWFEYTKEDDD